MPILHTHKKCIIYILNPYKNVDMKDTKAIIDKLLSLKSGLGKDGKKKAPYFSDELRAKVRDYLYIKYGIR